MGGEIYKIELYQETNLLGYIQIFHHKNKISISSIKVFEQRKKYGSLLLLIIINFINNYITNSYFIKEIFLDDCSDLALTKQTIYFKFAYRIMDKTNPEKMSLKFLTPKPSKKQLNRYYPYNEDISKSKEKLLSDNRHVFIQSLPDISTTSVQFHSRTN